MIIPVQPQQIAFQQPVGYMAKMEEECQEEHHNHCEYGCNSEHKKQLSGESLLSHRNVSAANTAASHGCCDSECDEVEIEIPGGFENILENEMSNSNFDESSEYVQLPKIQNWIGLDWDEVSITSSISQNRKDWMKGVTESHLSCSICCKKFRSQMEVVACELSHESNKMFKCPHMFCDSKYEKAAHLKSHICKKHHQHWEQFEEALIDAAQAENKDEIDLLLQPTESMVEALKPRQLL